MKDIKTKERFIELRGCGISYEKIAEELCVSKQTLINWSKELSNDIANFKAIHLEALLEKHLVAKSHRVKLFGENLLRLSAELESRDLKTISTEKVFDMLIRLSTVLKEEETSVAFRKTESALVGDFDKETFWDG